MNDAVLAHSANAVGPVSGCMPLHDHVQQPGETFTCQEDVRGREQCEMPGHHDCHVSKLKTGQRV